MIFQILFTLLLCIPTFAFRLSPIEVDFDLTSKNLTKTITLENPSNEKIGIKVMVYSRKMDLSGKETRVPSNDFKFFPKQPKLKGKQKRSIRLTYVGPKNLKKEKAYRIHVSQIPVKFKENKVSKAIMNINFAYEYYGSLYVKPGKVEPELVITDLKKRGKDNLKLIIENRGGEHALLTQYKPYLINKMGREIEILDTQLEKSYHRVNILAGGKRELSMSLPKNSPTEIRGIKFVKRNK